MANNKSARKRIVVAARNRDRNRITTSELRTAIKKFRAAVDAKDADSATRLLRQAHATIDKTAKKGVIHRATASRYKSRLAQAHAHLLGGAR